MRCLHLFVSIWLSLIILTLILRKIWTVLRPLEVKNLLQKAFITSYFHIFGYHRYHHPSWTEYAAKHAFFPIFYHCEWETNANLSLPVQLSEQVGEWIHLDYSTPLPSPVPLSILWELSLNLYRSVIEWNISIHIPEGGMLPYSPPPLPLPSLPVFTHRVPSGIVHAFASVEIQPSLLSISHTISRSLTTCALLNLNTLSFTPDYASCLGVSVSLHPPRSPQSLACYSCSRGRISHCEKEMQSGIYEQCKPFQTFLDSEAIARVVLPTMIYRKVVCEYVLLYIEIILPNIEDEIFAKSVVDDM